jgi:hypothetical protein
MLAGGEISSFRRRWERRVPRRDKPLQRKAFDVTGQLELKVKKEIPFKISPDHLFAERKPVAVQ